MTNFMHIYDLSISDHLYREAEVGQDRNSPDQKDNQDQKSYRQSNNTDEGSNSIQAHLIRVKYS